MTKQKTNPKIIYKKDHPELTKILEDQILLDKEDFKLPDLREQEIIKEHYKKIGRKGGLKKSPDKTKACRANAKKPRKKKVKE